MAEVQVLLNEMGYNAGAVDGGLGPQTRQAINAFQRDAGLPQTGQPDDGLLAVLRATKQVQDRQAASGSDAVRPSGAAAPSLESGSEHAFTLLQGYDLPYGDYRSGTTDPELRNLSSADCQRLCAADGRCRSFTYNMKAEVCILKETVPERVPFTAAVSGIKAAGIVGPAMSGMTAGVNRLAAAGPAAGSTVASPGAVDHVPGGATSGGRLVAPALGSAPIASPPAGAAAKDGSGRGSSPAKSFDKSSPDKTVGSEGLVICSNRKVWPLSQELIHNKIMTTASAHEEVRKFLESHGYDFRITVHMGLRLQNARLIESAVRSMRASVAFYDRNISARDVSTEIGSFGTAMRLEKLTSFCKLVVETSVCAKKLSDSEQQILGCDRQQTEEAPQTNAARPHAGASRIAESKGPQSKSPKPTGKWVVPAPAGAPIASTPQEAQVFRTPDQALPPPAAAPESPLARIDGGLDPLAPEGVTVGMIGTTAKAVLEARGYKGSESHFSKKGRTESRVSIATVGVRNRDSLERPVKAVSFEQIASDYDLAGIDFVNSMSERIGSKPNGCQILRDEIAVCTWLSPTSAPLVKEITLEFRIDTGLGSQTRIAVAVTAVEDLEERLPPPAPTVPTPATLSSEAREFDPVAPEGVVIGMDTSAVEAKLKANGLRRNMPIECKFRDDRYYDSPSAKGRALYIAAAGPNNTKDWSGTECTGGKIVVSLGYERRGFDTGGAYAEFAEEVGRKFGAPGKCSSTDWQMACEWNEPPNAPLYGTVQLTLRKKGGDLNLQIWAVRDILTRVALPAPPVEAKHWWDQKLAAWEAIPEKFSGSKKFAGLSADLQSRFRGEAAQVFDYCKGRSTYAAYYDCRCVAGKFVDARVERGVDDRTDINTLVGIAQSAVKRGQCQNKAGAAKYAFESCVSTYGNIIPETYKEVCGCYADVSAAVYENDPSTIGGAFVIQECRKRGFAFSP